MEVQFLLNGEPQCVQVDDPALTLLDWLRETQGLTGTKEGCNEGDCGACTVVAFHEADTEKGAQAINACITFLPMVHGLALRTIEGVGGPDGELHPIQQAMIDHHGSQCGFCTPGIVNSLVAAQIRGDREFDRILAGNLCRCTGYAPIIRAAEAVGDDPERDIPAWLDDAAENSGATPAQFAPETLDELAAAYAENPDATLVAGATDVGLWVTKALKDLPNPIFLNRCWELQRIVQDGDKIWVGAGVTIEEMRKSLTSRLPSLGGLLTRFASQQVRANATIGGNIANGSPIGDAPPALIALGATLHLQHGRSTRDLALEEFFLDYGKQDRDPGELVTGVTLPASAPNLRCYKISKRFDQDISALCGCFNVEISDGTVAAARLAFGGMAGIPKRASAVETALIGQDWSLKTVQEAAARMDQDFTPLTDMRASAHYRLETARNLLTRYFHDLDGQTVQVLEVTS